VLIGLPFTQGQPGLDRDGAILGPAGGIPLTGTALLTNDPGSVTVNLNIYRARLRAGSRDLALNY